MLAVKLALTLNWEGERERREEGGKNLKKKSEVIDVLIN